MITINPLSNKPGAVHAAGSEAAAPAPEAARRGRGGLIGMGGSGRYNVVFLPQSTVLPSLATVSRRGGCPRYFNRWRRS
jgi:hypothetical protein